MTHRWVTSLGKQGGPDPPVGHIARNVLNHFKSYIDKQQTVQHCLASFCRHFILLVKRINSSCSNLSQDSSELQAKLKTVPILPPLGPLLTFPFHLLLCPVTLTGFSFYISIWLPCYFYHVLIEQRNNSYNTTRISYCNFLNVVN